MFRKPAQPVTRAEAFVEELFLQRYEQMLEWALHLADHRAAQAEDLVHDAFVQLTLSPPDFKTIENLDGYLFVVLRNLHRSQMQRAMRGPTGPESLVDYDSAAASLKSADPREHWQAVEELQQVCRYACLRKESSKAGSALILRFFHGYYPGEVATLLCVSRPAIKELLRMARGEAKLFLDDPARLSFLSETTNTKAAEIKPSATPEETMAQLRQAIFATRTGRCLERKHLAEIYEAARPELLTVPLLAHLVSCPNCLEAANRLLGLSPLSDRDPNDMLGPDRGAQASSIKPKLTAVETSAKARQRRLKKYRQRLREVYEHEPQELRIAVNGFVLARQEVNSDLTRQTLGIEMAEQLTLIEVFSEQGLRLLAMHVAPPPDGQFEQHTHTELSHGRTITAALSFCGSWPHLEITYACEVRSAECGIEERRALPSLLFPTDDAALSVSPGFLARIYSALRTPHSALQWLLRPFTITVLLTALLLTVVVGQKLGWWFAPAQPVTGALPRGNAPVTPARASAPSHAPVVAPSLNLNNSNASLPVSVASPPVSTATASAELEIEALRILQQAKGDTHEQIEVRRTPAGKLRIEGLLDTDARKAELLQALSSLRANPAVEIQLQTVAEAARRFRASPAATATAIEREEVTVTKLPLDAELRRYFAARGVAVEQVDNEIERLAAATLQRSRQMARHAGALRQLAERFSVAQLQTLDAAARGAWLSLLQSHARSLRDETLQLRASLASVLPNSSASFNENSSINNDEELRRACERVAQLCADSDRIVRAAFTVSANAAPAAAIRTNSFFTNLHRIEHLAEAINAAK